MKGTKNNKPAILEGQWHIISNSWNLLGPPLRPAEEDLIIVEQQVNTLSSAPRMLILGVTPEYYYRSWPVGSLLKATDNSKAMIENVWPGLRSDAMLSSWQTMDWPNDSFDVVLCDGGLQLLEYPTGQIVLIRLLERMISADGLFIVRLFALPEHLESPEEVIDDLMAGKIDNLNQLKIRLGMAMQVDAKTGVRLSDIWKYLKASLKCWESLTTDLGWSIEHLSAINAYKDNMSKYHFMSEKNLIDLFVNSPNSVFDFLTAHKPNYSLGELCPTFVFKKKKP